MRNRWLREVDAFLNIPRAQAGRMIAGGLSGGLRRGSTLSQRLKYAPAGWIRDSVKSKIERSIGGRCLRCHEWIRNTARIDGCQCIFFGTARSCHCGLREQRSCVYRCQNGNRALNMDRGGRFLCRLLFQNRAVAVGDEARTHRLRVLHVRERPHLHSKKLVGRLRRYERRVLFFLKGID